MSRGPLTDERGFTLIEVMVAALVLVLAFTALSVVFINGQNESSATVEQSQLINAADQQVEQIRGEVNNGGFDALGLMAAPTVASQFSTAGNPTTVESTYEDPDAFAFTSPGSTACYDINRNYDSVTSAGLASETPPAFTQWSDCSSYGEPLEILGNTAMVQPGTLSTGSAADPLNPGMTLPNGVATHACASGSSTTLFSPCFAEFSSTYVNVYTFVTDTYIGCGTGSGTGTGTITTAAGASCPAVDPSSGIIQAGTCTFPASSAASTPCADSRRVTVAVYPVQVHRSLARLTPVYISTLFSNPDPTTTSDSPIGLTLAGSL